MNDASQLSLAQAYGPIFMIVAFALFIALAMFTLASLLGPKNPTPEKSIPYECGSESTGAQHVKQSVKFYLTAILFVVFDIEAIFLYPWAVLFQRLGVTGFVEMLAFLTVLTVALVYCWKKGALEWQT
ncbi:MAG: NADH-quinone oxidoreductase subunit A [Polyangiales bacterium]